MGGQDSFRPPLVGFRQRVHSTGYQWIDATIDRSGWYVGKPERCLIEAEGKTAERTFPLEDEPALFLRFADLSITEGDIKAFADRYGWLGVAEIGGGSDSIARQVEPFTTWENAIRAMRCANNLYEAFKQSGKKGSESLEKLIDFKDDSVQLINPPLGFERQTSYKRFSSQVQDRMKKGDFFLAARYYFWKIVNKNLERSVSPYLQHDKSFRFHMTFEPANLLGVLWLQVAQRALDHKDYKRCANPGCGGWIQVRGPGSKIQRDYCNDACKQAAYRHRKMQAENSSTSVES